MELWGVAGGNTGDGGGRWRTVLAAGGGRWWRRRMRRGGGIWCGMVFFLHSHLRHFAPMRPHHRFRFWVRDG
eukprot:scaffold21924_cov45-Isochrysis_galbana.AAC.1